MSYETPDVFYNPEHFGLKQVALIDYSDGNYCYDYRCVWRHVETGNLYTATDRGGSCPSPFEDYTSLESLTSFNLTEIEDEARSKARDSAYAGDHVADFIEKIRTLQESRK